LRNKKPRQNAPWHELVSVSIRFAARRRLKVLQKDRLRLLRGNIPFRLGRRGSFRAEFLEFRKVEFVRKVCVALETISIYAEAPFAREDQELWNDASVALFGSVCKNDFCKLDIFSFHVVLLRDD
jgi:hypothetical protein